MCLDETLDIVYDKCVRTRYRKEGNMNIQELKVEMIRHNDNGGDLAKALGISRQTLSRKFNSNNADFTQSEIATIQKRYSLTGERITEIFFAENVS